MVHAEAFTYPHHLIWPALFFQQDQKPRAVLFFFCGVVLTLTLLVFFKVGSLVAREIALTG